MRQRQRRDRSQCRSRGRRRVGVEFQRSSGKGKVRRYGGLEQDMPGPKAVPGPKVPAVPGPKAAPTPTPAHVEATMTVWSFLDCEHLGNCEALGQGRKRKNEAEIWSEAMRSATSAAANAGPPVQCAQAEAEKRHPQSRVEVVVLLGSCRKRNWSIRDQSTTSQGAPEQDLAIWALQEFMTDELGCSDSMDGVMVTAPIVPIGTRNIVIVHA
eukprot:s4885_g7.t1